VISSISPLIELTIPRLILANKSGKEEEEDNLEKAPLQAIMGLVKNSILHRNHLKLITELPMNYTILKEEFQKLTSKFIKLKLKFSEY
jgi:hypothetical protein